MKKKININAFGILSPKGEIIFGNNGPKIYTTKKELDAVVDGYVENLKGSKIVPVTVIYHDVTL